tara:strand:+ start:789 stop:1658 length:870 start_codon:yes stop_codon:yes gene_type:complete
LKKKKNLIIFGISSVVGKYFLDNYRKKYRIYGTYHKNKSTLKISPKFLFKKNLINKISIIKNFDFILHAASLRPERFSNQKKLYENNIKITKNIINFCIKNNIKKYVFLSSVSVYKKNVASKISEDSQLQTKNKYGLSKLKSEIYIKKMCNEHKISYLILRLPSILAKNSEHNFYSEIKKKLKKNQKITIFNGNKKFNNLIHVKYVSKVIYSYLKKSMNNSYILNLASIQPISLKEIISKIKIGVNNKEKIKYTKNNQNNIIINCNRAIKSGFFVPTVKQSLNIYNLEN